MGRKDFYKPSSVEDKTNYNRWYPVVSPTGQMFCSCGRTLNKIDEMTYRCSAGFPTYRFDDGEVMIDKFGNLCFRETPHPSPTSKPSNKPLRKTMDGRTIQQ